jgi:hypothetical protein
MAEPREPEKQPTEEAEQKAPWNAEGEEMPYHWPRGAVSGSRKGVYAVQALTILLIGTLIAMVALMIIHRL